MIDVAVARTVKCRFEFCWVRRKWIGAIFVVEQSKVLAWRGNRHNRKNHRPAQPQAFSLKTTRSEECDRLMIRVKALTTFGCWLLSCNLPQKHYCSLFHTVASNASFSSSFPCRKAVRLQGGENGVGGEAWEQRNGGL